MRRWDGDSLSFGTAPRLRRSVSTLLRGLETYVVGQAALIIDYPAARYDAEPISTAPTESTVQWLLHRRMGANQQMRWSPRGAHLMLKAMMVSRSSSAVCPSWPIGRAGNCAGCCIALPQLRTRSLPSSAMARMDRGRWEKRRAYISECPSEKLSSL